MKRLYFALSLFALAIVLSACGGGHNNAVSRGAGRTTIHITWPAPSRAIPQSATALRITAYINGTPVGYDSSNTGNVSVIVKKPDNSSNPSIAGQTNTAVIGGLPVGQQVSLVITAFAGIPAQLTGDPTKDNFDTSVPTPHLYVGSATPPPFTVKANDPNTVNTEVFSSVDHVEAVQTFAANDAPISDHTPKAGETMKITATAYANYPSGQKTSVVTSDNQWIWSRVDGAKPTPLLLAKTRTSFDSKNGDQVLGTPVIYCQGGKDIGVNNTGVLKVTLQDSGKTSPVPLTFAAVSTGSTIGKDVGDNTGTGSGDCAGGGNTPPSGFNSQNSLGVGAGTQSASRSVAGKGFAKPERTRDTTSTLVYVPTFDIQTLVDNACQSTQHDVYYRNIRLVDTSGSTGAVTGSVVVQEQLGFSGSYPMGSAPAPPSADAVPVIITRNSTGIAYAITGNSNFVHFYRAVAQGTYPLIADVSTDGAGGGFMQILDIHAAPATTDTSKQLTYVLANVYVSPSNVYEIVVCKDSDGSVVNHIVLTGATPKRFTVDEDGNLYVIDSNNQITKYTISGSTATANQFLFDPTSQTFNTLQDIYYDSGYIYVLDTTPDITTSAAGKARVAIFTSSGLNVGPSAKLGDADLDLTGHTLSDALKMAVSGKTLTIAEKKKAGETFDPVATVPLQ